MMVDVWADMFADDDAMVVALAVKKHVSVSKWAPSVAEIKEIMTDMLHGELIPPDVAWATARKAVLLKKVKELPQIVREAVESAGLDGIGTADERFDRAAFYKAYEPILERAKQRAMMGDKLSRTVDAVKLKHDDGSLKAVGYIFGAWDKKTEAAERLRIAERNKQEELYDNLRAQVSGGADENILAMMDECIKEVLSGEA